MDAQTNTITNTHRLVIVASGCRTCGGKSTRVFDGTSYCCLPAELASYRQFLHHLESAIDEELLDNALDNMTRLLLDAIRRTAREVRGSSMREPS